MYIILLFPNILANKKHCTPYLVKMSKKINSKKSGDEPPPAKYDYKTVSMNGWHI